MRRGAGGKRRDANERSIVAALRAAGATVEQLSAPDLPDLLVGHAGKNYLLEVKSSKGVLSEGQWAWVLRWAGRTRIVRTVEGALEACGIKAVRRHT
jgi:Holliday junction resolvase